MPPGSTPARFMAIRDEAPQSISTASAPSVSSRQVWKRPPLPNASPEPRNRSERAMAALGGGRRHVGRAVHQRCGRVGRHRWHRRRPRVVARRAARRGARGSAARGWRARARRARGRTGTRGRPSRGTSSRRARTARCWRCFIRQKSSRCGSPPRSASTRQQAHAVERIVRVRGHAGGAEERGDPVHRDRDLRRDAAGRDSRRPAGDQRHADPALQQVHLLADERPAVGEALGAVVAGEHDSVSRRRPPASSASRMRPMPSSMWWIIVW